MEHKKLVSSNQITKEIIGNFLLWELILQFAYTVIFRLITKNMDSIFSIVCIAIFLQFIVAIFVWRITLAKSFKKSVILYKDVPHIMQNLFIFAVIICLMMIIYNFSSVNSAIKETMEDNSKLQFLDSFVNILNDESISSKYEEQKQKVIEDVKNEVYKFLIVFDIAFALINLIIVPFERKQLLNYVAIEEDNI